MPRPIAPFKTLGAAVADALTTIAQRAEEKSMDTKPKSRRGFASMAPERRREIARKGGSNVPAEKRSFFKDRDLAATAGSTGGLARGANARTAAR